MTPLQRLACAGFAICLVGGAMVSASGQQPRFRSGADAVLVDVAVTAGGKPVTGLTAADFELRDSGVPQHIQVVSFADVPVGLLLALDVSSSVAGEPLVQLKQAARGAVDALKAGDQAALIAFGSRIQLQTAWTTDRDAVRRGIDALQANGWTPLYDTVFSALALGEQAVGRVVVLVFSDGADTASWLDPGAIIDAAGRSDVVVTVVNVAETPARPAPGQPVPSGWREGQPLERSLARSPAWIGHTLRRWFEADPALFPYAFLERLTEDTGGDLMSLASNRDLANAFQQIVANFRTRYLLTFTPTGVPASGWHPLDVRVTSRKGDVKARRGYWR